MAQLAIKGHPTRGNEVIEIFEMLGGKNDIKYNGSYTNCFYFLNNNIICSTYGRPQLQCYSLEAFLEKFPYKVGDKTFAFGNKSTVIDAVWDESINEVVYTIVLDTSKYTTTKLSYQLQPYKEKTMEVSKEFFNKYCVNCGSQRCTSEGEWLEECKHYKEETMEETKKNLDWHPTDYLEFVDNDEWADEVELNLGNSYEIQVRDGQTFAIKKQPQYPKTCEECLKILGKTMNSLDNMRGYKYDLFMRLQQLLISREAYWKIAGEQMGLGKPWELSIGTPIYYIYYNRTYNIIKKDNADDIQGNIILVFPTAEMCDAFYENFNDLIEACKELL